MNNKSGLRWIGAGALCIAWLVIGLYAGWKIRNGQASVELGALNFRIGEMADEVADLAVRLERAWRVTPRIVDEGEASWYGPGFHGRLASNREIYNQDGYTIAHRTIPLNTLVLVESLDSGRYCVARVTDRGPYIKGRVADFSKGLAEHFGMIRSGKAQVRIWEIPRPRPSEEDQP